MLFFQISNDNLVNTLLEIRIFEMIYGLGPFQGLFKVCVQLLIWHFSLPFGQVYVFHF